MLTDIYPEETSWTLTNVCTTPNTIQLDAPTGTVYTATETQFVTTYCVPPSRYVLEMKDTYGDGMCCNYGNGGFSIEYRGNVVMTGGEFGSEIQSDEFGDVCPTPAVSLQYIQYAQYTYQFYAFNNLLSQMCLPCLSTSAHYTPTFQESNSSANECSK